MHPARKISIRREVLKGQIKTSVGSTIQGSMKHEEEGFRKIVMQLSMM
ncbi:hypothetical protein [Salinicoccus sediminis]|nr:hypothetical protein [Salinicoccus sediminis]